MIIIILSLLVFLVYEIIFIDYIKLYNAFGDKVCLLINTCLLCRYIYMIFEYKYL